MKAYLSDRLYIPWKSLPDKKVLADKFEISSYDENVCRICDLKPSRPTDVCFGCESFKGRIELWKKVKIKDKVYAGVPAPSVKATLRELKVEDATVVDRRCDTRFNSKLKYTGRLYTGKEIVHGVNTANQVKLVNEWLESVKHGGGLIKATPRSGKTYVATYIACKLKYRTLITASQIDWLVQFCHAFSDSTNVNALSDRKHSPVVLVCSKKSVIKQFKKEGVLVKIVPSWEQVPDSADVVLSTYQSLIHNEERFKKYVAKRFALVIVDEVHQSPAMAFSRILTKIHARVRLGLSATLERKDHLSPVIPMIMGRIRAVSLKEAIVPVIKLQETGLRFPPFRMWHKLESALSNSPKRNAQIVDQVFKDLRSDPRHRILIPVRRVSHANDLVKMINARAEKLNDKGEDWPMVVAEMWSGKSDRTSVLERAKSGKRLVIVAIEKIVKHGLSVGPWSVVYVGIMPISNGPMVYQLARRVSTPHPNKPKAIVRWWLDNNKACLGCFRSLFFTDIDGLLKGLKDRPDSPRRYTVSGSDFKRIMEIARFPKQYVPPEGSDNTVQRSKPRRTPSNTMRGFF